MNETLKVIASRYTCRDYKEGVLPSNEILNKIGEAALQSPSARDMQAWRIIVVRDSELIGEIEKDATQQMKKDSPESYERIMSRGGKMFYSAPCLVVIPVDPSHNYALMDAGIVCQNIALSAESLGVASTICGMTAYAFKSPQNADKLAKKLGFPAGYTFGCSVLLGYAKATKAPHPMDTEKLTFI